MKLCKKEGAGMANTKFEPKIIGFLCNWCSYGGADLAGVSRLQYPPNVRIIRLMCSGRVDPQFVFKALSDGADGVLVAG
ncbi:Methyl-viologen-reducing hydrogenase, delta subunit [Candidatus Desulforudis audaxviator]|nr:Methyl-viologen-reducing hydrogenase, delta subunit [Candidatus Desulforudis audaxviator]